MSDDKMGTRALYDQTLIAAEELTDPEHTSGLTTIAAWKASATCLALLVVNLNAALTAGGTFPTEWVIGGFTENIPNEDECP
jgi:hypothetical protein